MGALSLIVMAVVFTAALAVFQSMYWGWVSKRDQDAQEMVRRLGMGDDDSPESLFREKAKDAAADALGGIGAHLQRTIARADVSMSVANLVGRMASFGLVGLVGGAFFLGVGGFAVAVVASLIPYFLLKSKGNKRQAALLQQLPDALDLMARSMQAGLGLTDTFRLVAEEMPLPIAYEFARIFEEIRLGREYRDALTKLVDRNPDIFDLRLFVSSVLLQRETGGNLIEVLNNISGTIRARFMFQGKVKAMTSEAKFTGYIIALLPVGVATFVSLANPAYLEPLVAEPLGWMILGYAISSYSLGLFIMNRMAQVEV
ncbi:MAG: type II secretion system F family protein [Deltaproteobacteria bacterium]|nr:type II secretion system F family protein [Deltaproteobacteria bacterium]